MITMPARLTAIWASESKGGTDTLSYNFKETMNKPERLAPGHRMCAGCGGTIAVRNVLRGLHEGDRAVIGNATGCLEVSTFTYPYTSWEDSYIHNAFENAGATLSGVEGAYKALKKKGKLDDTYKFITFGGDGGTYDIGFQSSLSAATAVPMTSVSSLSPGPWREIMTWCMSAMITALI